MESMATLNRNSALLMQKYKSHGATDVTGFGLLGHTSNLAAAQYNDVDLVLDAIPVIDKMDLKISKMHDFKVKKGFSAETSGGLLCMISNDKANDFIAESREKYGQEVWQVGTVVKGSKKAILREDVSVISIKESFIKL